MASDEAGWITPRDGGRRRRRSEAQPSSPGDSPPEQVARTGRGPSSPPEPQAAAFDDTARYEGEMAWAMRESAELKAREDALRRQRGATRSVASPPRAAVRLGGSGNDEPPAIPIADLLPVSPPWQRRGRAAAPPQAPPPQQPSAAASPGGAPRRPQRAAAAKARNMFAPLSDDKEMEEEYVPPSTTSSASRSSSSSPAPSPSPSPRGKKSKKKQKAAGSAKKKAGNGKPRKKRGEGHREDVAAAAAAAAISAAEAARMPAGLVRDGLDAIAKADAERKAATEKLERLSAANVPYVFQLRRLKEGEHGVAKAPYYSPARGAVARTLPSVAEGHTSVTSDDWAENRRRDDARRTASQRARRAPFVPGSKAGRTWCSRVEEKAGVNQPPPPSSAKSWRERLGLPEQPRPTEKQKRAVSLRVRFVDQTADAEGVMGAAPPAPGNKTRADVRRGFSLAGRGQACVYSEAVKIVYSLPEGEQGKLALNHGLLNKALIVKKSYAFRCKDEKGSPEYFSKKSQFDAEAALVQPLRDKFYGGKSLLEAEPWLQKVHSNVLTQALRDVAKAFRSNFAKLRAQKARGEKVKPFRVHMKDPRKRSSHTFYVLADHIKATHVPRPDLYNVAEAKRAAANKPPSKLRDHRARQLRERRQWTRLELPALFSGQTHRLRRTVVYLTRCADLDKDGKLLGDVRFTRDDLGRWNCVVQRRPRKVRPLRPVAERKVMADDQGVRDAHTCYSPSQATVTTYAGGERGIDLIFKRHLEPADKLIMELRELKRKTDFNNKGAVEAYEETARKKGRQKLRHFQRAKNMIREMHCRVARDMTANFDTILLPPFNTKDMARRRKKRDDGTVERRRLKSATVRRLLFMSFYKFAQLVGHRCLCDGSEKLPEGEEFTTMACTFCGTCYIVGSNKVFKCCLCTPFYVAQRDKKGAFAIFVKNMDV